MSLKSLITLLILLSDELVSYVRYSEDKPLGHEVIGNYLIVFYFCLVLCIDIC